MIDISPEQAKASVLAFLTAQFETKAESELKQLKKAQDDNEQEKAVELENKITTLKEKYQLETWMEYAAYKMAKQIGFGTHISKGIHSSSRGDNINFSSDKLLPKSIVGHQSLKDPVLDASGNAAALPLFALFNYNVNDNQKIKDFILADNASFKTAFSKDEQKSEEYFNIFKTLLLSQPTQPQSSELNKQTLWPLGNEEYMCLVPLYPSSLTHAVFEKINHLKFSEHYKKARENRLLKTAEQTAYPSVFNLAVTTIGGSNPQGVSQLMSRQRGKNYLLPSLPPQFQRQDQAYIAKRNLTIFESSQLNNLVRDSLEKIHFVIKIEKNNVDIRNFRKDALDNLLHIIFTWVENIRVNQPAGWSKDYELNWEYKYWLDPERGTLIGEEEFALAKQQKNWQEIIIHDFADWLNQLLKAEFSKQSSDFAVPEHQEWIREIQAMSKQYEREGRGIFS